MGMIATAVRHLIAAGVTGEALVAAIAEIEDSRPPVHADNAEIPPDKADAWERRRAWDRDRKRRKRSAAASAPVRKIPPDTAEIPPEKADISAISTVIPLFGGRGEPSLLPFSSDSGKKELEIQHAREDRFPEFWRAYPKREGTNPRKPAAERFAKAIARGVDAGELIAGAVSYGQHLKAIGKDGSQFVQQAVTWINQEGWKNEYHERTSGFDDRDVMGAAERSRARLKRGHWADDQGGGFQDGPIDGPDAELNLPANYIEH